MKSFFPDGNFPAGWLRRIALVICLAYPASVLANAEIVLLTGKGEKKDAEAAAWNAATLKDQVKSGGFVRTLANSQMGLLLPDRTQMRLNQNSQLQIKSVTDSAQWAQTTVKLNAGRAWSQARPQTAQGDSVKGAKLSMETPSATMSIRGTDWEVEVRPDGSTQLTVLSGTVEMANDLGSVKVEKGEAALAEQGKAPVKFILVNPKSRVQWVSAWRPQPARLAGGDATYREVVGAIESGSLDAASADLADKATVEPVAALLLADIRMAQGDIDGAIKALSPHADPAKGSAAAIAMLARIQARADKLAEGRALLNAAAASYPSAREVLLAQGELAILDGDVPAARSAFGKVLEQNPDDAEAWYGLGLIDSERENVGPARAALDRALAAEPRYSEALSERASVETFAGNLADGRKRLENLIAGEPDNYVAQTALGVNLLKSGKSKEALDAFLKAGMIEPRYARAWLFSGVAFYQLGERYRAVQAFRKAAELDAKDPLPHLLESLAIVDTLDYGAAIEAAQQAQELMPYLKSLNQVSNDQKGSANLGYALSSFGLEDWATWYAHEAYSPFWAGSHLFLADRYTGKFDKNSELIKGFITDPTSFGASNRDSSLIAAPGHYGKLEAYFERTNWDQKSLIGTSNGLVVEPIPLGYFVSGDLAATDSRDNDSSGDGKNFTIGLGLKPRHNVGVFAYVSGAAIGADIQMPGLPDDRLETRDNRIDLGANIKISADNQLWIKGGSGRQMTNVSGKLDRGALIGNLDQFRSLAKEDDLQFSQSISSDSFTFTWGAGLAHLKRPGELAATLGPAKVRFTEKQSMQSTDVYVSGEWKRLGPMTLQGDLWAQSARISRSDMVTVTVAPPPAVLLNISNEQRYSELNPRLGMILNLRPMQTIRLVGQRWRRPASQDTLGPVDTSGVPVNDRLPLEGGLYERQRLQFDQEFGGRWYLQTFIDHERVDNGIGGLASAVPNLELSQLEALRNRREVFTAVADIEETPQFAEGQVDTFGLAGNFLVGRRQSVSVRYLYRDSEQTGINDGLDIPYLSHNMLRLTSNWTLPQRWLLGISATYRDSRYKDALNLQKLEAGWNFGMTAYWESPDKRSSVQGIIDNLLSDKAAGLDDKVHMMLRYAYKF